MDEDSAVARPVGIHQQLEVRREAVKRALEASAPAAAAADGAPPASAVGAAAAVRGPRVIIVGPEDSGKSTLCRTLLAYAARMGWQPTWIDLDIGQGGITVPGCVSACPVDRLCLSVEHGLERLTPIAFFTGAVSGQACGGVLNYLFLAAVTKSLRDKYWRCHARHCRQSSGVLERSPFRACTHSTLASLVEAALLFMCPQS